jgi:DNA-binding Lrp family transcriptional regulator
MSPKYFVNKPARNENQMLTDTERKLLNLMQADFPITSEPFEKFGIELGTTESTVTGMIEHLKKSGIIRRIGAIFDSKRLGYKSTLCAMRVAERNLDRVADIVSSYPEVTHNYAREHDFNLWFTLIAKDEDRLIEIIEEIKARSGVIEILNLPAVNLFKINVDFKF